MSRYTPADAEEVYDIMNALDDRLATPNSGVVLAAVRVFLHMTLAMPYDHQQVRQKWIYWKEKEGGVCRGYWRAWRIGV